MDKSLKEETRELQERVRKLEREIEEKDRKIEHLLKQQNYYLPKIETGLIATAIMFMFFIALYVIFNDLTLATNTPFK